MTCDCGVVPVVVTLTLVSDTAAIFYTEYEKHITTM